MNIETPRLSPSIGHKLTTESALSAWAAHRLLGNFRKPATESQIAGRLWHAAILEGGAGVEVLDFDAFRSKEAKEARDKALHDGKIPIVRAKWDSMQEGVGHIHAQMKSFGFSLEGKVEERVEWDEQTEDGELVPCSGVLDHRDGLAITDIKSGSGGVTPHEATGLIARSHAILQDAAYRSAVAVKFDVDRERVDMIFLFVQTEEPYAITPVELDGEFRELSHLRWRRAIESWRKCLSAGRERKHWPGPVSGTQQIHPPGWMVAQELELEAMS